MQSVRFGKIAKVSFLVMVICVFSVSVASAGFFEATIVNMTAISSTGDVNVQFTSATGAWEGTARGTLVGSDTGSKTMVSTLLTAFSLGYNVSIQTDNTPSWDPVQVIKSVSVVAP